MILTDDIIFFVIIKCVDPFSGAKVGFSAKDDISKLYVHFMQSIRKKDRLSRSVF